MRTPRDPKDFADLRRRDDRPMARFELRTDDQTARILADLPYGTRGRFVARAIKALATQGLHTEERLRAELHRCDEAMMDLQARKAALEHSLRGLLHDREVQADHREQVRERLRRVPGGRHDVWAKARGIPLSLLEEELRA